MKLIFCSYSKRWVKKYTIFSWDSLRYSTCLLPRMLTRSLPFTLNGGSWKVTPTFRSFVRHLMRWHVVPWSAEPLKHSGKNTQGQFSSRALSHVIGASASCALVSGHADSDSSRRPRGAPRRAFVSRSVGRKARGL